MRTVRHGTPRRRDKSVTPVFVSSGRPYPLPSAVRFASRRDTYPKVHTRMQTPSARKSSRSPRFDSTTGLRRRLWFSGRALAAGLALALLAGSGIAVAAVASTAEAHNRTVTVTCVGIHIHGDNYNTNNGGKNTVTVTIDGLSQTDANKNLSPINFLTGYDGDFRFADPAHSYAYSAEIIGHDGYQTIEVGVSVPCVAASIHIAIAACTTAGTTLDLTATLGLLDTTHGYKISLTTPDAGGTNVGETLIPVGYTAVGGYIFHGVVPGHVYTATIVDQLTNLSAHVSITSSGCPKDPGIIVSITECTVHGALGGHGALSVTLSSLSFGRAYTVQVLGAANAVVGTNHFVADATGGALIALQVAGGGTYTATVIDDVTGVTSTKTSLAVHFLPCPEEPATPILDPTQCTSTNGAANSSISFAASGLVPGRSYQITVSNGTTNVYDSTKFVAVASIWPTTAAKQVLSNIGLGTYTVAVTDVTDLLLTLVVKSTPATLIACPKLPVLTLTPTQCTVPGGTGSIATTVSATSYIPGRTYNLGLILVQSGAPVVASAPVVAPQSGVWVLPAFANLAPGSQYRVTLTDSVLTAVSAYGDIALAVCPGMPTIMVQANCGLLGASTVNVSLDKLEASQTYTVNIVNASTNKNVGTATVPGTTPTVALQLKNIPNGNPYVVTVANAGNTLTGSASIFLPKCDLPTLAFTGANPVGPAVAGIGFLQLGLIFVGLNLAVRRRRKA